LELKDEKKSIFFVILSPLQIFWRGVFSQNLISIFLITTHIFFPVNPVNPVNPVSNS